MKVPTISVVVSFARNQMSSMPEVLWRGRTMAILGVVTGVCLLYLFRARLSQLLFGASQTDPVTKSKVENSTVSNSLTYRSFAKELISFQQFVEIHAHQLSEWLEAEESSPEWNPRLEFCKTLMLDIREQIERIRREGCEDTTWDSCKEQLGRLGSIDKGKEVCAELKNCLETLIKLNEQRMHLIEQKLPIQATLQFGSYEEYIKYLFPDLTSDITGPEPTDEEINQLEEKQKTWKKLSVIKIEHADIPKIQCKSFQLYFVQLRMYAGWDLVNKIKEEKAAYAELDMLYLIVKPFVGEIEELVMTSTDVSVQKKLMQMKIRLFSLLGEPKSSIKRIKKLEELDKERQILQLESYAKKQGLLA